MTLIYLYITIFTIYFIVLALVSMKPIRKIRDKYTSKDSNLCVVVYATGNSPKLENLLKQLKEQDYPKNHYSIHAILDKCENIPEITLQSDLNINVINVNNLEPIGKSQAYSIIAEKLHEIEGLDAYVFLNANNYVDSDFLTNVNFYLTKYPVFNPTVQYFSNDNKMSFIENTKSVYARYCDKFIRLSRTRLGLTNIINTDSFVIQKSLLNKIASFDFKDIVSEMKYSLTLAQEGNTVAHIDDLKVYRDIKTFEYRIPSLSQRVSIFFTTILKQQNWITKEFLCSFVAPNWLTCILCYGILLKSPYTIPVWINYSLLFVTAIIMLMAFCVSLMSAKLFAKEYLNIFAYPMFSIWRMLYNFPPVRCLRNMIKNTTRKHVIETMSVKAFVSDGKHDYPCQLELISDDGLAKVTLINRGKRYTTKNHHLRMVDAVRELSMKLNDKGNILKVCQCCKYFAPTIDGSTNMVKGCCNCQFAGRVQGDIIPTLIWNTCPNFEEYNVINLF